MDFLSFLLISVFALLPISIAGVIIYGSFMALEGEPRFIRFSIPVGIFVFLVYLIWSGPYQG